MTSKERTFVAMFSLATSIVTIAYTATAISYDMDTSVKNRRQSPKLWGMIPDEGRGFVFFLIVMTATFQVVAKVFSTALLATTNASWLLLWLSGDMSLFFLYKICRSDLLYFTPGDGALKYITAFLERFVIKTLVDFTGLLIFRNPYGERIGK